MASESELKILFVINPNSGANSNDSKEDAINSYFKDLDTQIETLQLTGTDDIPAIEAAIEKFKPGKVVAVGGDGTVTLVAKLLLGKDIALGIFPSGSANGMAKELEIPATNEALDIIRNGEIKNSDVILINNEHICLHLSDIGLNAQLVKHFEEGKKRGKLGYASVAIKTIWKRTRMEVVIKSGTQRVETEAVMVVLANATKYGTGSVINPEGSIYDGLFEVVIVKKLDVLFKMLIFQRAFDPKKIELFHANSVVIRTKRKVHFQVDGEYLGKLNRIEAEVLPGQLKLIVP